MVKKCQACCGSDKTQVVRDGPHGKVILADQKFATTNIDLSGPYNDAPSNLPSQYWSC